MKQLTILFAFLLGAVNLIQGQPWLLQGSIENAEEGPVLLASYYGDRFRVVDSMDTQSGFFYFMLSEDTSPGIYRIIYSDRVNDVRMQNRFVEFIFNGEHMELFISSTDLGPVLYIENSVENQVYREFMEFELAYEAQVMRLYPQLYPIRVAEDHAVVEEFNAIQLEREHYMDSISGIYPDLYAIKIINALRAPLIPGEISHLQRIDTLKACFFDQAGIDDPMLLHTPVYTYKMIDYLSLYQDNTLTKEEQEEAFFEAVDRIMVYVSGEGELREFVLEFLLEGFELLHMEQVQLYLSDNYLDPYCESDIEELVLSRMEGYKKMTPGTQAPDIILHDVQGRSWQLSELGFDYVLILFWSGTCPHCQNLMPQLQDWYLNENEYDLEVMAISIDTSVAEKFTWITAIDPLGWKGKASSDYNIYSTPSLFLLDGERTILSRPASFRQFQRALKKLKN